MSQRNEKGAAGAKTSQEIAPKRGVLGPRTRPEEPPEITHDFWQEWDEILMTLKECFIKHFQRMG